MASDAPWYNSQVGLQQRDYVRVQPSQQVLVIPKPTQPIILLAQGKSHALDGVYYHSQSDFEGSRCWRVLRRASGVRSDAGRRASHRRH